METLQKIEKKVSKTLERIMALTDKIDFVSWENYSFTPHLFDLTLYNAGCGFSAIATLTGEDPWKIKKKYKKLGIVNSHPGHCDEKFLIEYLRKTYEVRELTESDLLEPGSPLIKNNVTQYHTVLYLQNYSGIEHSFSVGWQKQLWHNFACYKHDAYEFVNRPVKKMWLLRKKRK